MIAHELWDSSRRDPGSQKHENQHTNIYEKTISSTSKFSIRKQLLIIYQYLLISFFFNWFKLSDSSFFEVKKMKFFFILWLNNLCSQFIFTSCKLNFYGLRELGHLLRESFSSFIKTEWQLFRQLIKSLIM